MVGSGHDLMEVPFRELSGGLKKTINLKIARIPNDPVKTTNRQPLNSSLQYYHYTNPFGNLGILFNKIMD